MARMLFAVVIAFTVILFFYQEYNHPQLRFNSVADRLTHPFDTRLRYSIGYIDPQFKLSPHDLQALTHEATLIWEQPLKQALFVYDPKAKLKIELIYDERQQESNARHRMIQEIEAKQKKWKFQQQKITQKSQEIHALDQSIREKKHKLNLEIELFNRQLQQSAVQRQLELQQTRGQDLKWQNDQLKLQVSSFNQKVLQFNQAVDQVNQLNQDIEQAIQQFHRDFQPRLFDKGQFNGQQILIYEFSSKEDLKLTLAHEFGHALGLKHHQDPKGLMHAMLEQQNFAHFKLMPSDLTLFNQR